MSLLKKKDEKAPRQDMDAKAAELAKEEDEDSKIARLLKTMPKWRYIALAILSIIMLAFQLYIKLVKPMQPWAQLPLHLCLALAVVFLFNPMADKCKNRQSKLKNLWWIYDGLILACIAFIAYHFLTTADALNMRIYNVDKMTPRDITVAIMLLFVMMEAVRRVVSTALFVVLAFFMAYSWFGQYVPGLFRFAGMTFPQFCETLLYGQNGIFGSPLSASLNTLFYFMIFGAFFGNCGGGEVLINMGLKLSDKSAGGPAKAAVLSSGLIGMISGSAQANVSTTGVFTIPLMKKAGYTPEEAGAVESVASTGGQIMPPIMGTGAFIMAEMIGVPYMTIAKTAILPALAYYGAVFVLVHLLAKKRKIGMGEKFVGKPILPRLYRLAPIVLLVVLICSGLSMPRSALYCAVLSLILSMLSSETRMTPKKVLNSIIDGVRQSANIAIPTGACGIMIGIVVRSGIAVKIAKLIGRTGGNSLLLALFVAAIGCLLLGMALPTVAAYLIANTLFCSAIMGLNVETLVANMFIFYFGVIAQITPPVCLASFTAAGIANASAWKTGWKAFSFAIVAFIAPFIFVFRPAMLLLGTPGEIALACLMTACATFFLATGVAGYLRRDLRLVERILFFAAALLFLAPAAWSDIAACALGFLLVAFCIISAKKDSPPKAA